MLLPRSVSKIPCMIRLFKTPSPLPLSRVQYNGPDASLSAASPQDMELEPLEPPFPFCQVGRRQRFTVQYARACPPTYVPPPSSSHCISDSILILRRPHYPALDMPGRAISLLESSFAVVRRKSHWRHNFCSSGWGAVNVFPPNMPALFLPHLYCRRSHFLVSILLSSSDTVPTIPRYILLFLLS